MNHLHGSGERSPLCFPGDTLYLRGGDTHCTLPGSVQCNPCWFSKSNDDHKNTPGESGTPPWDPCLPLRGTLSPGHRPRWGLFGPAVTRVQPQAFPRNSNGRLGYQKLHVTGNLVSEQRKASPWILLARIKTSRWGRHSLSQQGVSN